MKSIKPWYVAIFFQERCFGGREEGGWYFDSGVREGKPKAFATREQAEKFQERAQRLLDWVYRDWNKRELSSVLSRGRYEAELWSEPPPNNYPDKIPHYE